MPTRSRTFSLPTLLVAGMLLANGSVSSTLAEEGVDLVSPAWDGAINSLLAAGMYGFDTQDEKGFSIRLQQVDDPYKGLAADRLQLTGQSITFSYEGSAGLLGFSAGYIFTSESSIDEPGAVFLGIDPEEEYGFNPARSWYMAFDLAHTYQMNDALSFGFGSTTMLMENPFATKEGKIFSMLFNMPVSYKDYLTITPEFQWSRKLPDLPDALRYSADGKNKDSFYGGVSVTFSY